MSNFILAKLSGRNEFRSSLECVLLGASIKYQNLKIDTGAVKSLIPLRTINFSSYFDLSAYVDADAFYRDCKEKLINDWCKVGYMRGVTNKKEYDSTVSILDRDDVVLRSTVNGVSVGNYGIAAELNLGVSCDTHGNVLLGMDILKNFDYHCGDSFVEDRDNNINRGDHIFIGCLKIEAGKCLE